jgi:multidrug resistance efflux pump
VQARLVALPEAELEDDVRDCERAGVIARRTTDVGEWIVRGTAVLELVSTETVGVRRATARLRRSRHVLRLAPVRSA